MFCNKYNKYNVEFNFFFQEVKILKGDKFIKKKEKEKPVISEKGTERKKKKTLWISQVTNLSVFEGPGGAVQGFPQIRI